MDIVLDDTPLAKAIGCARDQREALQTFLRDGRIPIHNNGSERQLRRQAVGRKNWLFVGNPDVGEVNATFAPLIVSCERHGIEPWSNLRDLFCLLPGWPESRVLKFSPAGPRPRRTRALSNASLPTSSASCPSVPLTTNSIGHERP